MCCTVSISEMTETTLYVGEGVRDDKKVHVLAYQNVAVSDEPNAMVLPFPTTAKMTEANTIDTRSFYRFLDQIADASRLQVDDDSLGDDSQKGGSFDAANVFDVGSYTVLLANEAYAIPYALKQIPEHKRPKIDYDFIRGYHSLYPDRPIAVCCWDGRVANTEPLLWWYEPINPNILFIPTMDSHDGKAPKVGSIVDTDHIISVGAAGYTTGNKVAYDQFQPPEVRDLLPSHVFGKRLPLRIENADCLVKVSQLHELADVQDFIPGRQVMLSRGTNYSMAMTGWS